MDPSAESQIFQGKQIMWVAAISPAGKGLAVRTDKAFHPKQRIQAVQASGHPPYRPTLTFNGLCGL